jgi:hypothetical protein
MVSLVSSVLAMIAQGFISALARKVTEETWAKLQKDPATTTLKQAIGSAITKYAFGNTRLVLASALIGEDTILADPLVEAELAQIVLFDREPNTELLGRKWKAALEQTTPIQWLNYDFSAEATLLLSHLRVELRGTSVFRPVFDAKTLDAIAADAQASAQSLGRIESDLDSLISLLNARFGELARAFANATPRIYEQIRDYTQYIAEKTHGFVGRQFVFDAFTQFIHDSPRGYFIVRGDPGIGKTALTAQLVKVHGYIHHFNIRREGINRADAFLKNICSQLIATFQLDQSFLPAEATQDAGFLNRLLKEVSEKLERSGADERCILLIDALDEVEEGGAGSGVNPLYLPTMLPPRIYLLVTMRRAHMSLRIECEHRILDIEHDGKGNIRDVHDYVQQSLDTPGIRAYIATQGITTNEFVDLIVAKSEGNFMYLRYVLPEIESGAYTSLSYDALPQGLQNYYESHWHRMRKQANEEWFAYKLPVIIALTVTKQPISIDLLMDFSGVSERPRVRAVLDEWFQFLHSEDVPYNGGLQRRYSLYHASFHDFIAEKEEVADEQVSQKAAHKKIADVLWAELFDE